MITYYLFFIFSIFVLFNIIIKIGFNFWSNQPVFQIYNIRLWLNRVGHIIEGRLPRKNLRFYDFNAVTENFNNLSTKKKALLYYFIKTNYNEFKYSTLKKQDFISYFSHDCECNLITYVIDYIPMINSLNEYVLTKKLLGCISQKKLYIKSNNTNFAILNYNCINNSHKMKSKFANNYINKQNLLYTHCYNSRNLGNTDAFLFKSSPIKILTPFTIFYEYVFTTRYLITPNYNLPSNLSCVRISADNFKLILHFFGEIRKYIYWMFTPDMQNLKNQIISQRIIPFILLDKTVVVGVYFYRNDAIKALGKFKKCKNKYRMSLIGSFCLPKYNKYFTSSLQNSLFLLKNKCDFTELVVENISHNYMLLKYLLNKQTPKSKTTMAYYMYNYAITPIYSPNLFILY